MARRGAAARLPVQERLRRHQRDEQLAGLLRAQDDACRGVRAVPDGARARARHVRHRQRHDRAATGRGSGTCSSARSRRWACPRPTRTSSCAATPRASSASMSRCCPQMSDHQELRSMTAESPKSAPERLRRVRELGQAPGQRGPVLPRAVRARGRAQVIDVGAGSARHAILFANVGTRGRRGRPRRVDARAGARQRGALRPTRSRRAAARSTSSRAASASCTGSASGRPTRSPAPATPCRTSPGATA